MERDQAKEDRGEPVRRWDKGVTLARDVLNKFVQDQTKITVVGADVEALYPNLADVEVANICFEAVMGSKIIFRNINYRKALLYLATCMHKTDQRTSPLWGALPRRTSRGGVRPGVTASPDCEVNWYFPSVELTNTEKRLIVATVIKVGILVMMNTHVYAWNGETYLQRSGGPIGLRSTCAVARVVMNVWDARWLALCEANNIVVKKKNRYMDDIRAFLKALKEGWRWDQGVLCHSYKWVREDMESGKSATKRTAEVLVDMMNSVYHFLNFTIEVGEDFKTGTLPSLDTEIGVEAGRII